MFNPAEFKRNLTSLRLSEFEEHALRLFQYQWKNNVIYQTYCTLLDKDPNSVKKVREIPFLPIEFFKTHRVVTGQWNEEHVFQSSGTTSANRSKSYVRSVSFYHQISRVIFERTFGPTQDHTFIGLLPSYLENPNSSLISMIDYFMSQGANQEKLYIDDLELLKVNINKVQFNSIILFGVTYALLEHAGIFGSTLPSVTIIETGGMKGRKKELVREDVHAQLRQNTGSESIYSEYGMTELTSQAYGRNGRFMPPEWLKVQVRDTNDPFCYLEDGKVGGLNIIDLANVDTCAFIETKDLGKLNSDGTFEVLGRFDNSEIRGCSLLI